MYNIENLELEWKRYRYKKVIFPILFIVLLVVFSSLFIWTNKGYFTTNETTLDNLTLKEEKKLVIVKNTKEKNISIESHINTLDTSVPSLLEKHKDNKKRIGQIIFQNEIDEIPQKHPRKNLLIQVTERKSTDLVRDIENRFEFAKDKADSLFLAKYYYDKKDYHSAEKWALETNKLDNMVEESWIIFAKSLAKQGKRIDALKVLRAFIDQTSSEKARLLMDKVRRGKRF